MGARRHTSGCIKSIHSGYLVFLMHPLCRWSILNLSVGIFLLALAIPAKGQHYNYNKRCQKAHQLLLERKLVKAGDLLQQEENKHPGNLIPQYLYHYRDFLRLYMYGNGQLYEKVGDRVGSRLQQLKEGPESSPYHDFTLAEVHLIWSLLQVRKGDYFAAGMDLYQAYNKYKSTTEKFPDFLPAQRMLVAIKGMVGTLPSSYQWIMKRFGISGDLQQALDQYPKIIDGLDQKPRFKAFHRESLIIYSYMQLHLMDAPEKAWETIQKATKDHKENPFSALLRANMALNMQKAETTLSVLKRFKTEKAPIPYIDYLIGSALLYDLQPRSRHFLDAYVRNFQGGTYVKDSYLKMGWSGLLNGDMSYYNKCRKKLKSKGSTVRSVDEQALKEADQYDKSNRYLLKARLAYDGGYFQKALRVIQKHPKPPLGNNPDLESLEYYYRLGRIHQALDHDRQALETYAELRHLSPEKRKHYYLPAAVLQSGLIHEELGQSEKAKTAFQKMLNFDGYPYEEALSQKAKAGLKRLKADG